MDHDFAREEEDLEELFDEVDIPAHIRDARMQAVHDQQIYLQKGGFGSCEEITEERRVLEIPASEEKCIIHFMHPEFHACNIMQSHIDKLASTHYKTKFIKVNAEKCHWVCAKLNIRELPAVLTFIGAKNNDRVIGFDELGGSEGFSTEMLEDRLARSGVIESARAAQQEAGRKKLFGFKTAESFQKADSDSDDDE